MSRSSAALRAEKDTSGASLSWSFQSDGISTILGLQMLLVQWQWLIEKDFECQVNLTFFKYI